MPFKATYSTYDGKKVILTDQRGEWKIFAREAELPAGVGPGMEVEFEYDEKQGQFGKFKVLKSMRVLGAAGMTQAGAAAPRQAAPAGQQSTYVPDEKTLDIFIQTVLKQHIASTGDTSTREMAKVCIRAIDTFRVVDRYRRTGQGLPEGDNPDPDQDRDAPF